MEVSWKRIESELLLIAARRTIVIDVGKTFRDQVSSSPLHSAPQWCLIPLVSLAS